MKTIRLPFEQRLRGARARLIRSAVLLGSLLVVVSVFLFTQQVIHRLTQEVETTSRLLARYLALATFPATRDPELLRITRDVVGRIDFPIIITDPDGYPRAWRKIAVPPEQVPDLSVDSLKSGLKVSPVIRARIERVRAEVARLDRQNEPLPMLHAATTVKLGAVHYGEPEGLGLLRWIPLATAAGVVVLLSLGLWSLAGMRAAEKRTIWVGMARETAHQLGTPLSSLMGWVELLRSHAEAAPGGAIVPVPRAELDETLEEIERDVERLNKVAQRFSHVGSAPHLVLQDVTPVVIEAVQYMRKRLPQGGSVSVRERYEEVPPINLNRELLEWALENLLVNAVSAVDKSPGLIEVAVERRGVTEAVEIMVRDNGRGMTPAEQRRAFDPGYSTKQRGWGLGLALARRVVEEYHGGRLSIRQSAPGQGTTMVISFPT
ncbi:MAG TPA: HAMP domain-containing sensor histidine kinase [Terriglobales bacterium]|nr:HAMP domain-containing sensor histidine kinase [Terriglobales bacterium]